MGDAMLAPVHVRSVATAVPPHRLPQSELAEFARRFFGGLPELGKLLQSFGNAGIDERQLARPVAWYEQPHSFADKNEVYREVALSLSEQAGREALQQAGVPAGGGGSDRVRVVDRDRDTRASTLRWRRRWGCPRR